MCVSCSWLVTSCYVLFVGMDRQQEGPLQFPTKAVVWMDNFGLTEVRVYAGERRYTPKQTVSTPNDLFFAKTRTPAKTTASTTLCRSCTAHASASDTVLPLWRCVRYWQSYCVSSSFPSILRVQPSTGDVWHWQCGLIRRYSSECRLSSQVNCDAQLSLY